MRHTLWLEFIYMTMIGVNSNLANENIICVSLEYILLKLVVMHLLAHMLQCAKT